MPLEVKASALPRWALWARDEDERARYASYALQLRGAEAVTVRCYVDALMDGLGRERPVVALGDVNDEPFAATTTILLGPPGSEIGPRALRAPTAVTGSGCGISPR